MKPRVLELGNKLFVKPVFRSVRAVVTDVALSLQNLPKVIFPALLTFRILAFHQAQFPSKRDFIEAYIGLLVMSYSRLQRHDKGVNVTVKIIMNKLRITRSEFSVLLSTSRN